MAWPPRNTQTCHIDLNNCRLREQNIRAKPPRIDFIMVLEAIFVGRQHDQVTKLERSDVCWEAFARFLDMHLSFIVYAALQVRGKKNSKRYWTQLHPYNLVMAIFA